VRKALRWTVQLVVAGVVLWMVWDTVVKNWGELRSLDVSLTIRLGWIGLATLVVFASYALSVEAWRRILAGWAQRLAYGRAARVWLVANLGRYIPGKVWSVAGLMVLAQRAGVAPWAAGASAFAIQAVAIGTAVAVVAAAAPQAASPFRLGLAALIAAATIVALTWGWATERLARLMGRSESIAPLPLSAVIESSLLGLLAWLAHGVAFWLLARGLGLPPTLSIMTAAGVFPLGYLLGLLALFAPGGVGVREVVLFGLLAPTLGGGGAAALTVASRILLTFTEVVAPLVMLLVTRSGKEDWRVRT